MDRCSGSERRPNLDHHVSNPSPHFDPAAGVFLRRPTVPRRLGRKTLRCPRRWRGGPDRHFSVGRQPSLRAGSPAPPRSRTATVSPGRLSAFACFLGILPTQRDHAALFLEVVTGVRPNPPHCWSTALACVHPLRREGINLGLFGMQFQHRVSLPGQHRHGHTHRWHSEHRSKSSSHLLQFSHRPHRLQCGADGFGGYSGENSLSRQALPSRKNSRSPQASSSLSLARAEDSMRSRSIGSVVRNGTWRSIPSGDGSATFTPPWALTSPLTAVPVGALAASVDDEARGHGSSASSSDAPSARRKSRTGSFCSSLSARLLSVDVVS